MASRKNLKKVITYIADQLATQAFFASYDKEASDEWIAVFDKIFALNREYIARVSHAEPGLPARKYFDTLCISFNEEAKSILDEIQQLSAK